MNPQPKNMDTINSSIHSFASLEQSVTSVAYLRKGRR
jgi:hypothetical protein